MNFKILPEQFQFLRLSSRLFNYLAQSRLLHAAGFVLYPGYCGFQLTFELLRIMHLLQKPPDASSSSATPQPQYHLFVMLINTCIIRCLFIYFICLQYQLNEFRC